MDGVREQKYETLEFARARNYLFRFNNIKDIICMSDKRILMRLVSRYLRGSYLLL